MINLPARIVLWITRILIIESYRQRASISLMPSRNVSTLISLLHKLNPVELVYHHSDYLILYLHTMHLVYSMMEELVSKRASLSHFLFFEIYLLFGLFLMAHILHLLLVLLYPILRNYINLFITHQFVQLNPETQFKISYLVFSHTVFWKDAI
jgi:hypothetical protein